MKSSLPSWFKLGFAVSTLYFAGDSLRVFCWFQRVWGLFAQEGGMGTLAPGGVHTSLLSNLAWLGAGWLALETCLLYV